MMGESVATLGPDARTVDPLVDHSSRTLSHHASIQR